jgi:2-dehydropantoate 2-reductase
MPDLSRNRHAHTILFLQNNPAGFDEYVRTLGAERVMAGFVPAGGERRDPVMRVMPLSRVPMPIGEVDGRVTERTRQVAALLEQTGKRVEIRRDMDAWLVSHVPAVLVFAGLYAADLDPARYARTRDAMLLGVRAREEALQAQPAAGIPLRPPWFHALPWMPEPAAVGMLKAMAGTRFFEVGVAAHSRAARDEMAFIAEEYRQRIAPGGVPTPYLDQAIEHVRGTSPLIPDGSRELPMRWTGLLALVGTAVAAGSAMALRARRGRR